MPRRTQITSETILQEQKPNDPLNKFRLLWHKCKRLMPKGGILSSGGQLCLSGLSHSSSATQRAQGWLRLAMTSVVDLSKLENTFILLARKQAFRSTSPRQLFPGIGLKYLEWVFPSYDTEFTEKHRFLWELQHINLKVSVQRSQFAGEKLFVTWVKDGFHIVRAIPNALARKSTFSTAPLAPDLLLDRQNYFHFFSHWGLHSFWNSAASKYIPHVAASEEETGSFPSTRFQDNHFQVSNSPRWSVCAVWVYQGLF